MTELFWRRKVRKSFKNWANLESIEHEFSKGVSNFCWQTWGESSIVQRNWSCGKIRKIWMREVKYKNLKGAEAFSRMANSKEICTQSTTLSFQLADRLKKIAWEKWERNQHSRYGDLWCIYGEVDISNKYIGRRSWCSNSFKGITLEEEAYWTSHRVENLMVYMRKILALKWVLTVMKLSDPQSKWNNL